MEKGDSEDQLAVDGFFFTVVEPVVRDFSKRTSKVSLDTSGRLCGQLDTVLEYRNREELDWGRSQEETERVLDICNVW